MLNANYFRLEGEKLIKQATSDINNYEEGRSYRNVQAYTIVQLSDIVTINNHLQRVELFGNKVERKEAGLLRKRAQEILTRDARMDFSEKTIKPKSYADIRRESIKKGLDARQNRVFGYGNKTRIF